MSYTYEPPMHDPRHDEDFEREKANRDYDSTPSSLPRTIMVLVSEGSHAPSKWIEYHRGARTMKGLISELNKGIREEIFFATRLIYNEKITYGILDNQDKPTK